MTPSAGLALWQGTRAQITSATAVDRETTELCRLFFPGTAQGPHNRRVRDDNFWFSASVAPVRRYVDMSFLPASPPPRPPIFGRFRGEPICFCRAVWTVDCLETAVDENSTSRRRVGHQHIYPGAIVGASFFVRECMGRAGNREMGRGRVAHYLFLFSSLSRCRGTNRESCKDFTKRAQMSGSERGS